VDPGPDFRVLQRPGGSDTDEVVRLEGPEVVARNQYDQGDHEHRGADNSEGIEPGCFGHVQEVDTGKQQDREKAQRRKWLLPYPRALLRVYDREKGVEQV